MKNNNKINENEITVSDIVVYAQPTIMLVQTEKEILEINSPDGKNWYAVNEKSRIAKKIDIAFFNDCEVVQYKFAELPQPIYVSQPVLVGETFNYSRNRLGNETVVQFERDYGVDEYDNSSENLFAQKITSNSKTVLADALEWDEETGNSEWHVEFSKTKTTPTKEEEKFFHREVLVDGVINIESVDVKFLTSTRMKTVEWEVATYAETEYEDDFDWLYEEIRATKDQRTATSSKWQSAEIIRQDNGNSMSEYLWCSYDEENRTKHVMNMFEITTNSDEYGLTVYIEGDFCTSRYIGNSYKEVEFVASYENGTYVQNFWIFEENSRKSTTREVTRTFDGTVAEEKVTTTVTDYRKDTEVSSISSSMRLMDYMEGYDAYADFLDDVQFYTGYDLFEEVSSFESEAMGVVSDMSKEYDKFASEMTNLAVEKGSVEREFLTC